jgi:hypothetical protein
MKQRIEQVNFIKIKYVCSSKNTVLRMREKEQIERKYLQKIANKGLLSQIYKELLKLNNKKTIKPNKT